MKENTVLLSLKDYNELKRIEREYEEFCETDIVLINGWGWDGVLTTDSAIKGLSKSLKESSQLILKNSNLINKLVSEQTKYNKVPGWVKYIFSVRK